MICDDVPTPAGPRRKRRRVSQPADDGDAPPFHWLAVVSSTEAVDRIAVRNRGALLAGTRTLAGAGTFISGLLLISWSVSSFLSAPEDARNMCGRWQ